MRVLLATDGSASADRARDLVAGLPWPHGTVVRIVMAVDTHLEMLGSSYTMAAGSTVDELDAELLRHAELTLDLAETDLRSAGLDTERVIIHERAASAILEEARDWNASLVVMGSRGHSPLATAVLGSTSAEVVDHAPCPVLIARDRGVSETVLACDGSAGATLAEAVLTAWPVFRRLPVTVVTVSSAAAPWHAGVAGSLFDPASIINEESIAADLREAGELSESVARRLRRGGLVATSEVRQGDPASEIVSCARARNRPLVILGSRGHTGLARLLLGGVARNVLNHADGSVLIARQGARVDPEPSHSAGEPLAV